jgi:hypothetical protein
MSLALVLAPSFVLGISPALVPPHLFWLAAVANTVAAVLLAVHAYRYLAASRVFAPRGARGGSRLPGLHLLAFGALAVIIAIAFVLLLPGIWANNGSGPLRIFYLHDLLLGWVSSALLILIDVRFALVPWAGLRRGAYVLWEPGVAVMLAALLGLGLTGVVPLPALTLLQVAAWASVPVAAAAVLLLLGALAAHLIPQAARRRPEDIGVPAHR